MTERNDENKRPPVLSPEHLTAIIDVMPCEAKYSDVFKAIAEAQWDADAKFYEGVMQRMVAQMRKVLKPVNQARRDTVYEVKTFLEEQQIALFYTYMKGDEQLVGDRANTDIIRRVLKDDA